MQGFTLFHWLIVAAIVYVLVRATMGLFGLGRGRARRVCTTCGHHGRPVVRTRGSLAIEVLLWLCLLVPGLVYSLWRLSSRSDACESCGATTLVPDTSPIGRRMLAESPGRRPDGGDGP